MVAVPTNLTEVFFNNASLTFVTERTIKMSASNNSRFVIFLPGKSKTLPNWLKTSCAKGIFSSTIIFNIILILKCNS